LDGSAEFEEPFPEFVGGKFINGAESAVAKVVDIIDVAFARPQIE
jgi:hypothetical protein